MSLLAAAAAMLAALCAAPGRSGRASRRLLRLRPQPRPRSRVAVARAAASRLTVAPELTAPSRWSRRLRLATAMAAAALVVASFGVRVGLTVAVAVAALLARRRWADRSTSDAEPELPLVVDVLAACLTSGAGMPAALVAASRAAEPSGLALACRQLAQALADGGDAEELWRAWSAGRPARAAAARVCARGTVTGSAMADELVRVAARQRARRRVQIQQRVQRASVWVVLPLGLCFLPAFVLVGVVPLVLGLLPGVL